MIVVALIGILAAIAVPFFSDYMRRSRTTEADVTLKDLWMRARTYRAKEVTPLGNLVPLPPQFPDSSAGPAPVASCCQPGGRTKCAPDLANWADDTWQVMNFSIEKAHYYRYELTSDNSVPESQSFTIHAYGDLDCDGIESTFTSHGLAQGLDVTGSGAVGKTRELE